MKEYLIFKKINHFWLNQMFTIKITIMQILYLLYKVQQCKILCRQLIKNLLKWNKIMKMKGGKKLLKRKKT